MNIKAIIGLGNPGPKFSKTRHNIGFRVVEALAEKYGGNWRTQGNKEIAEIALQNQQVLLVKPQTFMNNSGEAITGLSQKGIKPEHVVVVHDELELPFGQVKSKTGGSAKGHNGLKSIIEYIGDAFHRIRCGIGRPLERDQVPDYVLAPFKESTEAVEEMILNAVSLIEELIFQ
jgi:peptidyl-tRNA hydrolase, PTH1 family